MLRRFLRLPDFLAAEEFQERPSAGALVDGFALTGFFLARHVLEPRGLALSDARSHFVAAIVRALKDAA